MHFNFKRIGEISEAEFIDLIDSKVKEDEHIDFKQDYEYKEAGAQLDMLKDIAAFANAERGYILIGIHEADRVASKFASLDAALVAKWRTSITSLCANYIHPPIKDLQVETRTVQNHSLLVIRIPPSTGRPHMVGFDHKTHFCRRHQDGKKEMTYSEIKDAFTNAYLTSHLDSVKISIESLGARFDSFLEGQSQSQIAKDPTALPSSSLPIEQSSDTIGFIQLLDPSERVAKASLIEFERETRDKTMFYIGITPSPLFADEINPAEFDHLIKDPPESRLYGWNMANLAKERRDLPKQSSSWGHPAYNALTLLSNGHMNFKAIVNRQFFWPQPEEEWKIQGRFSPYALIEYPISFLRLYKQLLAETKANPQKFFIKLSLRNIGGTVIAPGHPLSAFFDAPGTRSKPFHSQHLPLQETSKAPLEPETVGYELVKQLYQAFGLQESDIPFFDFKKDIFDFQ
jgi:hypothetical protein